MLAEDDAAKDGAKNTVLRLADQRAVKQDLAAANHALQEHAIRWTPELTTVSLDRIDAALNRFDRAVPMVKKQLLYACAATVFADGDVSNHEAELLRAVADTIGCPVPPYHHPALS